MTLSPQLILAINSLINKQNPTDERKNNIEKSVDKFNKSFNGLSPLVGTLGSLLGQSSISNGGLSNVGVSALGGGLQGLASFGLPGAVLGGISGLTQAAQSNTDFYDTKALNEAFNLSAKTLSPSILGDGGFIDGDELVPVQMEVDELYVTDDLSIYDSKAKKKHKDMDDEEITDVVKDNSFAFSEQKKMKPSTHADKKLGYGFAHYSEDGNYALEKVTMADVFGDSKKEITFSKAADMIRKAFKVVRDDDKDADLITRITNDENRQARTPFVNELINIHEGNASENQEPFIPQKFAKGGVMKNKVKKYNGGGPLTEGFKEFERNGKRYYEAPDGTVYDADFVDNIDTESVFNTNGINSLFDETFNELESFSQLNQDQFSTTNRDSSDLFNRLNNRNAVSSLVRGFAEGLQSTRVDPRLQDARFVDESFEEISPAIADQISSEGIARANSLVANVARSSPGAAERIAPRLFDSALRQSNSSRLNISNSNLAQRRGKYKFLNQLGNINRNARIDADEATRSLINQKRNRLADVATDFLGNRNQLDVNKFQLNRQNLRSRLQNDLQLFNKRLALNSSKINYDLNQGVYGLHERNLQEAMLGRGVVDILPNVDVGVGEDIGGGASLCPEGFRWDDSIKDCVSIYQNIG